MIVLRNANEIEWMYGWNKIAPLIKEKSKSQRQSKIAKCLRRRSEKPLQSIVYGVCVYARANKLICVTYLLCINAQMLIFNTLHTLCTLMTMWVINIRIHTAIHSLRAHIAKIQTHNHSSCKPHKNNWFFSTKSVSFLIIDCHIYGCWFFSHKIYCFSFNIGV